MVLFSETGSYYVAQASFLLLLLLPFLLFLLLLLSFFLIPMHVIFVHFNFYMYAVTGRYGGKRLTLGIFLK